MNNCAVILAAGEGKRMKSKHSKVLCEVLFKPMLGWVLDAAADAGAADRCVVTGHGCGQVEGYLQSRGDGCETVRQGERRTFFPATRAGVCLSSAATRR